MEVYKLRVQREDADAAIGIAVGPGVGGRRVVDRQDLQHPLMGGYHEVYHHAEVAEVADTEAPLRTEREHRYQRSGQLLVGEREEGLREVVTHQLALVHPRQVDGAVQAVLPHGGRLALFAEGHELELQPALGIVVGIKVHHPFIVVVLRHGKSLVDIPVSKLVARAHHAQLFTVTELRGTHLKPDGLLEFGDLESFDATPVDAVGEGRAVEIGVLGDVCPATEEVIEVCSV